MVIERDETFRLLLINSVSLSPLYLINLLISHPRTSSKKGLCGLCVETDTKQDKGKKVSKKTILFDMQIILN
jgi:hypothetical protein